MIIVMDNEKSPAAKNASRDLRITIMDAFGKKAHTYEMAAAADFGVLAL